MIQTSPKVQLIASTNLVPDSIEDLGMERNYSAGDVETLIEFAGRNCYRSFHRPNPETADTDAYIARTVFEQGHMSIAEHTSFTFYIEGVSRAFLTELTRHRHLSFSVQSQRFVNEDSANVVIPPAVMECSDPTVIDEIAKVADYTSTVYTELVEHLLSNGLSRKQAREAARCVLPNMTETRMVVTGNLRTWIEVVNRRTAYDADAEMQQVIGMVRDILVCEVPVLGAFLW